jgi:hypothetical protein
MRRLKTVAILAACAALGGSIAWGLLGDAALARDRAFLESLQRAEDVVSFQAVRTITVDHPDGAVTTVLKILGRDGERRVEFVEARPGSRRAPPGPFSWMGQVRGVAAGSSHIGAMARFAQIDPLLRNYRLVRLGRDEHAGRPCDRFELRPKHPGRAAYRVWSDVGTRLVLRVQVLAADDSLACDIAHESIAFGPVEMPPRRARRPATTHRRPVGVEELRGLAFQAWLPERLPAGFQRLSMELIADRLLVATYTDGLAYVFVAEFRADEPLWQKWRPLIPGFAGPAPAAPAGTLVARRITHAGGTLLNVTPEGTEVFVLGQLGADELEGMVRSLKKAN